MTRSNLKAIKCNGKRCKEVFHVYENYVPGGINDCGFIVLTCKRCGALTRVRMKNPSQYGYYDNFEIVSSWEDGETNEFENVPLGQVADVMEYESPEGVLIRFHPYLECPFWACSDVNLEMTAQCFFVKFRENIEKKLYDFKQAYLAGQLFAQGFRRCLVIQKYRIKGREYQATWCKKIGDEGTMTSKEFYLVDHDSNDKQIDGVYSRDEMLGYLERCLIKWKLLANQVVVVTPFIGFDLKFSTEEDKKELIELWGLLNSLLDINKTCFVTRMSSYSSLKKFQKEYEVPADVLKEWDLMSNLQKMFDNPKTRVKTKEQFHAKLYAGVFDDHVELLSGSYNVQTGKVLEQMSIRNMTKEMFKRNYLDKLVEEFEYQEGEHPKTLCLYVDEKGEVREDL